jgi:hypothetical protein
MTELVEVAFLGDEHQAAMIQALLEENGIPSLQQQVTPSGPQLGYGLMGLGGGSRRIMVHAHRAEEARALVTGAMAESENEVPESVNAQYLEEAQGGRGPRNYGLIGAYARIYLVSFVAMSAIAGSYFLLRAIGLT